MDQQPMDALAWMTVMVAPICLAIGVWLLSRLKVESRALSYGIVLPVIVLLFGASAGSAARIVNRFVDYDHCVASGAARFGAGGDCPQWTVDAYRATAPYREI